MLQSLFNKVAGLKICNSVRKRLQHRCFPVKFEKISKNGTRKIASWKIAPRKIAHDPKSNPNPNPNPVGNLLGGNVPGGNFTRSNFPVTIAFFTEQLQWLLLRFNSCFQKSPEQKPVRLSIINTKFS